jgi:hypothetical protein
VADVDWLETLDKYDALLPVDASFVCEFGDQLDIAYDFFGEALLLPVADAGADWFGDQLLIAYDFWTSPVATFPPDRLDV